MIKAHNFGVMSSEKWEAAMSFVNLNPIECDAIIDWAHDTFPTTDDGWVGYKADKTSITVFFLVEKYYALALLKWT